MLLDFTCFSTNVTKQTFIERSQNKHPGPFLDRFRVDLPIELFMSGKGMKERSVNHLSFRCLCVIGYNASTIVDVMGASPLCLQDQQWGVAEESLRLNQTHQGARWNVPTRRTRRTRHADYCVWFGFGKECHVMPLH